MLRSHTLHFEPKEPNLAVACDEKKRQSVELLLFLQLNLSQ